VDSKWLLRFAVLGVETQLYLATCALFRRVDDARIEGSGIDVKANRTLIEFAWIHHAVDRITGVDSAGMRDVHLHGIQRLQPACSGINVLAYEMEILHLKAPNRNRHPAILVTMVMDRAGLTDLPANRHQFIKSSTIDKVSGVVLTVPIEIWRKRVRVDGHLRQEPPNRFYRSERRLRHLPQPLHELVNGHCLSGCMHRVIRAMSIAQVCCAFARSGVNSDWNADMFEFFRRSIRKAPVVLVGLFATGSLLAGDAFLSTPATGRFILSPLSGRSLLKQCSRLTPGDVSGFWRPSSHDVDELETYLSKYLEAGRKGNQAMPPSGQAYHRQYVGFTRNSERFIYGNFYPASAASDFSKDNEAKQALVVCDGGPAFWGIVFRVSTKSFEEIRFNGFG